MKKWQKTDNCRFAVRFFVTNRSSRLHCGLFPCWGFGLNDFYRVWIEESFMLSGSPGWQKSGHWSRSRLVVVFSGLVLVLLVLGIRGHWFSHPPKEIQKAPSLGYDPDKYRTGHVSPRDFELWTSIPGVAHAFREVVVYAHVPGYLQKLPVDKGDVLRKGALIAKIFDPERDASLQREEALARIAKLTYDREYAVWKKDPRVISLETLQKAEASWKAARARALYEKTMTDYEVIRAPFDGMVTRRFVDPGNLIPEARMSTGGSLPIIRLAEVSTIRVYIGVPSRQVRFVKRGEPVEITVQGLPGRVFRGRINRYAFYLNRSTRTMKTEIDLDNPDLAIHPGMFVDARIRLGVYHHVLSVARKAVIEERHGNFVYRMVGNRREKVPVITGITNGGFTEILQGLKKDDTVLVDLLPAPIT